MRDWRLTEVEVDYLRADLLPLLTRVWEDGSTGTLTLSEHVYLQWGKWPEGMQIECVSDHFLPENLKLSFTQRRKLAELGFSSPSDESPNYYQRLYDIAELSKAAEILARVAVEVWGWTPEAAWEEPD